MANDIAREVQKGLEKFAQQEKKKKKLRKPKRQRPRSRVADKKGRLALKAETEKYGKRFSRKMGGSIQSRKGYTPAVMTNHENYNDSVKRKYGGGKI